MERLGRERRWRFWALALLWLPAGVVVQALVCLGQDSGPAAEPGTWLATAPMMAGVAPAGCARAAFRSRSGAGGCGGSATAAARW